MPGKDHSFMGEHPATETIYSFSTNCIYCEAWNILDRMNAILGISDGEPAKRHAALKAAILGTFWNEEEGKCNYLRYPDGRIDPSQELAGISFGVLFGILPEKALENLMQEAYGIPSIMPPFPGLFTKERPGRHNNLVWPFLNGFYIQAAAGAGKVQLAGEELKKMAALYNSNEGIFEIYNPYDGSVDGGWQIGLGRDTQLVSQTVSENAVIYLYRYRPTEEYFLSIVDVQGAGLQISDPRQSDFYRVGERGYYGYVPGFAMPYQVEINGETVVIHD
jgi:hypothetical protein